MKLATDFLKGTYLKQDDFALEPKRFEILKHDEANVAQPGEPERIRALLHFVGEPRPMVLNATNIRRLIKSFGKDMDEWQGEWVEVYVDDEVMFGSEQTGGLRLRAVPPPKKPAPALAKKTVKKGGDPVQELAGMADDTPWEADRE